jgi:hypothetical protein
MKAEIRSIGKLSAVQFPAFDRFPHLKYGSFTRHGGVSSTPFNSLNTAYSTGDDKDSVTQNRNLILEALGLLNTSVHIAETCHSNNLALVEITTPGFHLINNVDGIFTQDKNTPLFMSTADCSPVFYYDVKSEMIGLVHIGWKGIVNNLAKESVNFILKHGSGDLKSLYIAIGPSIGYCCYKLKDAAQKQIPEWNNYLKEDNDGYTYIDLRSFLNDQFVKTGIPLSNFVNSNICPACNTDNFFSYFSEKPKTGRFASIIAKNHK